MMVEYENTLKSEIPQTCQGMRADKALALVFPQYSRSTLQKWLKQGLVVIDDEVPAQRDQVQGGELVELVVPQIKQTIWRAQSMELNIVYEDDQILVINKPAGLVVHPGAGNPDGTLVNGLLHHYPKLSELPRAGIVHRLDKDTTGLMLVARTESSRLELIRQLAQRTLQRTYLAVVQGVPIAGGVIDAAIGRDPHDRRRMMVSTTGKPALTHYRVQQRFRRHALLCCKLDTGRTHQIRVHMKHIGFPLVGDPIYGGRRQLPPRAGEAMRTALSEFSRQALHAAKLAVVHPGTGRGQEWSAPMPLDLQMLVDNLERDAVNSK